jgi:hypothetical protein
MRMRIRDLFNPGSGMEKFGYGINIPDPLHWLFVSETDMNLFGFDSGRHMEKMCHIFSRLPHVFLLN